MAFPTNFDALPAKGALAVIPSDSTDLTPGACRALYIGTGGNVSLVTTQGDTVLFKNVAAGSLLPVAAKRVRATNTTAANIIGLY